MQNIFYLQITRSASWVNTTGKLDSRVYPSSLVPSQRLIHETVFHLKPQPSTATFHGNSLKASRSVRVSCWLLILWMTLTAYFPSLHLQINIVTPLHYSTAKGTVASQEQASVTFWGLAGKIQPSQKLQSLKSLLVPTVSSKVPYFLSLCFAACSLHQSFYVPCPLMWLCGDSLTVSWLRHFPSCP